MFSSLIVLTNALINLVVAAAKLLLENEQVLFRFINIC